MHTADIALEIEKLMELDLNWTKLLQKPTHFLSKLCVQAKARQGAKLSIRDGLGTLPVLEVPKSTTGADCNCFHQDIITLLLMHEAVLMALGQTCMNSTGKLMIASPPGICTVAISTALKGCTLKFPPHPNNLPILKPHTLLPQPHSGQLLHRYLRWKPLFSLPNTSTTHSGFGFPARPVQLPQLGVPRGLLRARGAEGPASQAQPKKKLQRAEIPI